MIMVMMMIMNDDDDSTENDIEEDKLIMNVIKTMKTYKRMEEFDNKNKYCKDK